MSAKKIQAKKIQLVMDLTALSGELSGMIIDREAETDPSLIPVMQKEAEFLRAGQRDLIDKVHKMQIDILKKWIDDAAKLQQRIVAVNKKIDQAKAAIQEDATAANTAIQVLAIVDELLKLLGPFLL